MDMGPCPACRRHVRVSDRNCPFCGAAWSRRGFLTAAAVLIAAPVADAVRPIQETKYGGAREQTARQLEVAWIWNRACTDWRTTHGFWKSAESWAGRKPGTAVSYTATAGKRKLTAVYKLSKVTEGEVTLTSEVAGEKAADRTLSRSPAGLKWAKAGKEEMEIDGTKHECEVKTCTLNGQELKVWFVKDGWVRMTIGAETTRLLKHAEAAKIGAKEYSCAIWETTNGTLTIREWRSNDVPGLLVKWEEMIKNDPKNPPVVTLTLEATSISEGK